MFRFLTITCALLLLALPLSAQGIPEPVDYFGFTIGEDRKLADWQQLTGWYSLLAARSDRMILDTLGETTEGLPFVMLTVTSPDNHARLDELRDIQLKLADPRLISGPAELAGLLDHGKTVVLLTEGIHATEVGGPQMSARMLHRMATSNDEKVSEILDNVILLNIPSLNPDGLAMIVDWYRRWVGTEYEAASLPTLYNTYVGHDNNRDWYAFTQVETELAVTKGQNAWHPQIVHDLHQMGSTGARIFFPPFIDPWEPNIDPLLTAGVNQLGSYMAAEVLSKGMPGVVTNAIYDAFTPARAYQHYHGGVRILSETASIGIASPVTIAEEELSGRRGPDPKKSASNFPIVWPGGEWHLMDIVDYMDAGVMALLTNAAKNRRYWLENFYQINKNAVDKWPAWPSAWILPASQRNQTGLNAVLRILTIGDVEVHVAHSSFAAGGRQFEAGSYVIPMNQPYASFAQTMLSRQEYPDLRQYPGGPPLAPYDVVAHTLPLLMDVEAVAVQTLPSVGLSDQIPAHEAIYEAPPALAGGNAPRIALYKSWRDPSTEGWTRWVLDQHSIPYDTLHDGDIQAGALSDYDVLLFEDQGAEQIRTGWEPGEMPPEYVGGLGSEGLNAVREFVERGGRMVAIAAATDFAVGTFGLGVSSTVDGLSDSDFYIPGSILRLDLADGNDITDGVPRENIAWYWRSSRAFSVEDPAISVLARYGVGNPLLSGWVLGQEHVAGKPALLEAEVGDGSVVLFGFPPNYRGQTIATWPLLFNAFSYQK
ncbi:M14 family metallopeptidase [Gemmatimonadota bacterium]